MTGGPALHVPTHPVRIVTAASLFDGHDAAINIMRRILQSQGCEVIHLGHNRSVHECHRGRAGGRPGRGGVLVPGRPRRVLPLPGRRAAGRGPGPRAHLRRRWRRDRPERDRRAAGVRRHPHLLAGGRAAHGPGRDGQHDRRGVRRRPGRRAARRRSTSCSPATRARWPAPSPPSSSAGSTPALLDAAPHGGRAAGRSRCSASPAPAGRASRRSPTSWCGGSASTRRTSSASPCSPSTPPGAAAAVRCSATASA